MTLPSDEPPEETAPSAVYVAAPPWVNEPDTLSDRLTPSTGPGAAAAWMVPASLAPATWESSDTIWAVAVTGPDVPPVTLAGMVTGGRVVPAGIGIVPV